MKRKTELSDFHFKFSGYGHFEVTYKSPANGKEWHTKTDNMPLIDATKNAETPKRKDLDRLKFICKNN